MNPRIVKMMQFGLYGLACIAGVVSLMFKQGSAIRTILLIAAIAALVLGLLAGTVFYRCPHCGAHLPPKGPTPDTCPECGKRL